MSDRKQEYNRRKRREKLRRRRKRRRILLIVCELLFVVLLVAVAFGFSKWAKVRKTKLNNKNLEAYKDTGPYTNIALFGLDSRKGEISGGVNSDTIIVVSINNKTNQAKMVSVYRDCLMRQDDGSYNKANSAYNFSGPEEAIAMLNRNLDMDIKNYVSVDFAALATVINDVGGIELDISEEERELLEPYAVEIIETTGIPSGGISGTGVQTVDGVCATAYARVRYTEGGDFVRAQRQRIVLEKTVEKLQTCDLGTLNKVVNDVLPMVSTSFSATEMLGIAAHATQYSIGDNKGFPFEVTTSEEVYGMEGTSFVVPIDLANNVTELHQMLFDDEDYVPSETVQEISDDIIDLTDVTSDASNMYDQSEKQ